MVSMEIYFSLIGLLFSILYSGSEIALISANSMQIKVWQKQKMYFSSFAKKIMDEKPTYITVILIGTNLSNVLATSFFTIYLSNIISNNFVVVCIIAGIILLFGEVIPKTIKMIKDNKIETNTIRFKSIFLSTKLLKLKKLAPEIAGIDK